jgi:hypothetical protein
MDKHPSLFSWELKKVFKDFHQEVGGDVGQEGADDADDHGFDQGPML